MKKWYLYRLFQHSRFWFLLAVLFIITYGVLYSKKMSMMLFPYNSMYSIDFYHNKTGEMYAMKVDGRVVPITDKWYWKKDFLETSLRGFVHYTEDSNRVFLDHYIPYKFHRNSTRQFLLSKLTPGQIDAHQWAKWYLKFAGERIAPGQNLEVYTYHFEITENGFKITDSTRVWKSNGNE